MDAPKCRLCQRNHWLSVACNGRAFQDLKNAVEKGNIRIPSSKELLKDIQREGRRVLKGSTGKPAKPTRTPATAKADPPRAMKAKGGARPTPEPTVREPGATARPAKKKANPRRAK